MNGRKLLGILLLLVAILLMIGGILLIVLVPFMIKSQVAKTAQLTPNSSMFDKWTQPKYVIRSHMTMFSVENPDEIMNGSVPIVSPIGPFVFDQSHRKKVKEISKNGHRIKFRNYKTYYFNRNLSCANNCTLQRRIWIPNLIYQKFVEAASVPAQRVASAALLSQTPFLEVEVGEFLYQGYKDPFLDQICAIPFMNFLCESILELPERIGLFYGINGTNDGEYIVETGVDGSDLGRIVSWNGNASVPQEWWGSDQSRAINGTDGGLFHPFISKNERLYVFVSTLCRSVYLTYSKDVTYEGVPAYRFVMPADAFDTTRTENEGFCFESGKAFFSKSPTVCLPPGLIDISRCQKGEPPVVISLPNFLYTPPEVKKSILGLDDPVPEVDEIFVDIEPRLGTVLRAMKQSQINIAMWKGEKITFPVNLEKFRNSIVPVAIVREKIQIDDESLQMIKDQLIRADTLASSVSLVLIFTGIFICSGLLIYSLYRWKLLPYIDSKRQSSTKTKIPSRSDVVPVSNGKYVSTMCQPAVQKC